MALLYDWVLEFLENTIALNEQVKDGRVTICYKITSSLEAIVCLFSFYSFKQPALLEIQNHI